MKLFRNLVNKVQFKVNNTLSAFTGTVKKLIITIATFATISWTAAFFYGTFYYYYVPVVAEERPAYFHFSVCENGIGICSFPIANISLIKEHQHTAFKVGQSYKIVLDIDLPESQGNRNLGMFMIEMRLYNKRGETVHTSARATSLQYKSSLLYVIETLVFSPFLLFGYMDQKQSLHIELFSEFIDNSYNPSVGTVIEVKSMKVELYKANLKIFAQFSGVRYFLYYWPITSAIFGISWNFILLSFIALLSWYQFWYPWKADGSKPVYKIDFPRKKKPEGSPKKALMTTKEKTETVGATGDIPADETSQLIPEPMQALDQALRLRQPHNKPN